MHQFRTLLFATVCVSATFVAAQQGLSLPGSSEPNVLSICTDGGRPIDRDKQEAHLSLFSSVASYPRGKPCEQPDTTGGQSLQIRRRGHSSDAYAKSQYQLSFHDHSDEDLAIALVDMPMAEKWVLNGPYVDRSYMRDALAFRIGSRMGAMRGDPNFAMPTRFVELYVDNDYRGLYLLSPKVQRGKGIVDIPKFALDGEVASSYMLEVTVHGPDLTSKKGTRLQYSYPGRKKMQSLLSEQPAKAQANPLLGELDQFEAHLKGKHLHRPSAGYASFIERDSFVDFLILEEVAKNLDGFRSSIYIHKDAAGLLRIGPLWDFNIAFGNVTFIWGVHHTKGWVHGTLPFYSRPVFWFKHLLKDPAFVERVVERYTELRMPGRPLSPEVIDGDIDTLWHEMGKAPERDHLRWLGTHTFVQRTIVNTRHRSEVPRRNVEILRRWLHARLAWMDANMASIAR